MLIQDKQFSYIYHTQRSTTMKGITGTVNYAVYIFLFIYFPSISLINPNHFINLLREIPGK